MLCAKQSDYNLKLLHYNHNKSIIPFKVNYNYYSKLLNLPKYMYMCRLLLLLLFVALLYSLGGKPLNFDSIDNLIIFSLRNLTQDRKINIFESQQCFDKGHFKNDLSACMEYSSNK